jgi:hypothetical protein
VHASSFSSPFPSYSSEVSSANHFPLERPTFSQNSKDNFFDGNILPRFPSNFPSSSAAFSSSRSQLLSDSTIPSSYSFPNSMSSTFSPSSSLNPPPSSYRPGPVSSPSNLSYTSPSIFHQSSPFPTSPTSCSRPMSTSFSYFPNIAEGERRETANSWGCTSEYTSSPLHSIPNANSKGDGRDEGNYGRKNKDKVDYSNNSDKNIQNNNNNNNTDNSNDIDDSKLVFESFVSDFINNIEKSNDPERKKNKNLKKCYICGEKSHEFFNCKFYSPSQHDGIVITKNSCFKFIFLFKCYFIN